MIWYAGASEEPSEPNQTRLSNIEEALAEDFGVKKQMRLARQGRSLSTVDATQKSKAAFQEIRVQLKPEQMRSIARRFGMTSTLGLAIAVRIPRACEKIVGWGE